MTASQPALYSLALQHWCVCHIWLLHCRYLGRGPPPRVMRMDHDAWIAHSVPGTERRSAARMALPRRLLQVPAGFNFAPGPGGQPAKQPWSVRPPPDVRGAGAAPASSPPVLQLTQSLNGVAMAGVVASASPALTVQPLLMLSGS